MSKKAPIKQYLITILVSLLFAPIVFLAQIFGNIIGELYVWFNNFISFIKFPFFLGRIISSIIAGTLAGYISALLIFKIYKDLSFQFALIFPLLLIVVAIAGDIYYANKNGYDLFFLGHIIRNPLTFIFYFIFLKEFKFKN